MRKIKKVLILGSGGLKIGQAGEFDYSGSQAIKALKEEGIYSILINPNIATVQTDFGMADKVYLLPLNLEVAKEVIAKERPCGIFLSFGGQTALNLGLELERAGVLEEYEVEVLGTPLSAIDITEDRSLFKQALDSIEVKTAKSFIATNLEEAIASANKLQYPLMLRSGFSLGGLGSGKIENEKELIEKAQSALSLASQILLEEYLGGWKELEYEIVRDCDDNTLAICNMENFDPMGIHTGESIVIAPSQTLSNTEYHQLRSIAFKTVRHLKVVGECNIQFALNPKTGDYRVIEVNARLSRSSALASKATGYPLAFVAAKLALGFRLFEIKNKVTNETTAFFEPSLDYVAVKMPRWDIQKMKSASRNIGSEMKSVGEVMAIGRSFGEALQKAIRMLNIGASSLFDYPYPIQEPLQEIREPTDRRVFAIGNFLKQGGSVAMIHELSSIDLWFLHHIAALVSHEKKLQELPLDKNLLEESKKMGFSDLAIAKLQGCSEEEIREARLKYKIFPYFKLIDTSAGEFEAITNYLYCTYHASSNDVEPLQRAIVVLGSGPYCIGSSVEFDWCAVNALRCLKEEDEKTILINSNPETVSTDYDESTRLYFEELTLERVRDIADFENPKGILVSMGGQIANNLALPLSCKGYPLLGTDASCIDMAEDRKKFSTLLASLEIDQPEWIEATSFESALAFGKKVDFPLLIRPSYVLSGAAMNVVYDENGLKEYLKEATLVSDKHPVVISKFISHAKELEIDGVAYKGRVVIDAIAEHVENAGVHSGDATLVLPPQKLYLETIRQAKAITKKIAKNLMISGPFNIQFIAKDNALKVIECNLRAARSLPFVSKVTGHNFIKIAIGVMLGRYLQKPYSTLDLDYVAIKTPQFSYQRLKGANPVAHVEMASTGEVACLGNNLIEAFFASWHATEQKVNGKRLLVSIGGDKKERLIEELILLSKLGWEIFATPGTHTFLEKRGVKSTCLYKASDLKKPNVLELIDAKKVDVIINIPKSAIHTHLSDGFKIRRLAIDRNIALITNLQIASYFLQSLVESYPPKFQIKSLDEFVHALT